MNRYSVITAVAIVVIVSPFAFSGLSILGAQQLEYRWNSPGEFSFFALSNHGEVEFCNTVPFWISLQKFEIAPHYAENHMGTYTVEQMTLNPSSSEVQQGTFRTENYSATQQVFLTFDFQFNGGGGEAGSQSVCSGSPDKHAHHGVDTILDYNIYSRIRV